MDTSSRICVSLSTGIRTHRTRTPPDRTVPDGAPPCAFRLGVHTRNRHPVDPLQPSRCLRPRFCHRRNLQRGNLAEAVGSPASQRGPGNLGTCFTPSRLRTANLVRPRTPSYAAESILNSGAAGRLREENLSPATAVGSRGAGRGFVGEMERSPIQSAGRPDDSCSGGSAVKREAVCSAPRCSLRLPPRWSHLGSATHAHRTHVTGRTHELRIRRFRAMCRAPEPQE